MADDVSPEEKLLRLIRGKQKAGSAPEESRKAEAPEEKKTAPEAPKKTKMQAKAAVLNPLPEPPAKAAMPRPKPQAPKRKTPNYLAYILTLLFIAALSLSAFLFHAIFADKEEQQLTELKDMLASITDAREDNPQPSAGGDLGAAPGPAGPQGPDSASSYKEYEKVLSKRNIFRASSALPQKRSRGAGDKMREMIKDYKLVGIVPGDEPQAIIEDRKSQQTLFLRKGEYIGEMEVRDIASGKIVLGYYDETITLSL